MKGYKFYAEMPQSWQSKSGCRDHEPFTRRGIADMRAAGHLFNVCAVFDPRSYCNEGALECLSSVFDHEDSDTNVGSVSRDYLAKRCVLVSETLARKCHPRLFTRLDEAEAEGRATVDPVSHTSGDWTFDGHGINVNGCRIATMARVPEISTGDETWRAIGKLEQDANAHLLGAAAALLDALRDLQASIHEHHKMNVRKDYSLLVCDAAANKAIAKATGK